MMLLRIVASRTALVAMSIFVIIAGVESLWHQFAHLYEFLQGVDFQVDIELEEDIAIILVCIGVVMEERGMFTEKLYGNDIPELDEKLNDYARDAGTYCLLIGLTMEVLDQLYNSIMLLGELSAFIAASIIFIFHILSIIVLLDFSRKAIAAKVQHYR